MIDQEKLSKQFAYLAELKAMKPGKLLKHHRDIFYPGHKFHVKIPSWMHRSVLERRLWYYYTAKNYHYPKEHTFSIEFRKKAKHILSKEYIHVIQPEEEARQQLKNLETFNKENIDNMSINEVDRHLISLGLFIEASDKTKRKVLWEWFNCRPKDLPKHKNKSGKMVRANRKGTVNNKFVLRDLILENPTLDYSEFMTRFGDVMPTVTRGSYNVQRSILRKAGYDIPKLTSGIRNPAIKRGVYGQFVRARKLNEIKDG